VRVKSKWGRLARLRGFLPNTDALFCGKDGVAKPTKSHPGDPGKCRRSESWPRAMPLRCPSPFHPNPVLTTRRQKTKKKKKKPCPFPARPILRHTNARKTLWPELSPLCTRRQWFSVFALASISLHYPAGQFCEAAAASGPQNPPHAANKWLDKLAGRTNPGRVTVVIQKKRSKIVIPHIPRKEITQAAALDIFPGK